MEMIYRSNATATEATKNFSYNVIEGFYNVYGKIKKEKQFITDVEYKEDTLDIYK